MNTEAKKNLVAALLYITLAIMIVSVVCIAVVSVAKRAKNNLPTDDSSESESISEPAAVPSVPDTEAPSAPSEPAVQKNTDPIAEDNAPSNTEDEPAAANPDDQLPDRYLIPASGYVSKAYENDLPVYSVTMNDYRIHDGIDVACAVGSEVYSCADGTIESIYEDPLMGYAITVYHGGGLRSTYLNLAQEYPDNLCEGAQVAAGQVIGYVGDSALIECAEPEHLHFIMTLEEETVDPLNYIEYEGAVSSDAIDFED